MDNNSSNKKLNAKQTIKILSLIVGVSFILTIVVGFIFGSKDGVNIPRQKLNLEVRFSRFEKGFAVPVITIKNLNDFEWQDCKVKLNDNYEKTMDTIHLPSTLTQDRLVDDYQVIASSWFTKDDGTKFDPMTTEPKTVLVRCNKPYYDIAVYKFNN